MLRYIYRNSSALVRFLLILQLHLSRPQRRHITNVMDALLVCEDSKTLSALHRQLVKPPSDVYALCDCFRASPWSGADVRTSSRKELVDWAFQLTGPPKNGTVVYLKIDDSLTEKDRETEHLEAVDWHCDYRLSTKKKKVYKKGLVHVHLSLQVGTIEITVNWRLYLRERTVRRLNRQRAKDQRLKFRSKYRLAREMLLDIVPLIPDGYTTYVLFDSWYASAKLIRLCKMRLGCEVICAVKSNRHVDGITLCEHNRTLRHHPYERITLPGATGQQTTYLVRSLTGRMNNMPFTVRVFVSKRYYGDGSPCYFLSTDTDLSAQKVFGHYQRRWSVEVDNLYLKTRLGLGDFRVQSVEAIEKWYALVFLTYAYLQRRLEEERSERIRTIADVIRLHQQEHLVIVFRRACFLARRTKDIHTAIDRFFQSR